MPTIRLVEIHPIIVHFPIALLIVGVLLDFLALFLASRPTWSRQRPGAWALARWDFWQQSSLDN